MAMSCGGLAGFPGGGGGGADANSNRMIVNEPLVVISPSGKVIRIVRCPPCDVRCVDLGFSDFALRTVFSLTNAAALPSSISRSSHPTGQTDLSRSPEIQRIAAHRAVDQCEVGDLP